MIWYTQEGSEAFNQMIHETLQELSEEVKQAVGPSFEALVLSGGYGREEGACVIREGRESLYNDLDLFLITRSPYRITPAVREVQRTYEHLLKVDVDIGAPLTVSDLHRLPHELMWQDLLYGHVVLSGPEDVITGNCPEALKGALPQVEAIRLLLNRGSGLLQAIREAHALSDPAHQLPDPDFIRRNMQKAALAFGDGLCIVHGTYTVHLPDRLDRLQSIMDRIPTVIAQRVHDLYRDAIVFKQRPDSFDTTGPSLQDLLDQAELWVELFLYVEEVRTGSRYATAQSYRDDRRIRERAQHSGRRLLRNLLQNARRSRVSLRYPREELYRDLTVLLSQPQPHEPSWQQQTQTFLHTWNRYN
jgi:hypothetical protein